MPANAGSFEQTFFRSARETTCGWLEDELINAEDGSTATQQSLKFYRLVSGIAGIRTFSPVQGNRARLAQAARTSDDSKEGELAALARRNEELTRQLAEHVRERRWLGALVLAFAAAVASALVLIGRFRRSRHASDASNAQLQRSQSDLKRQTAILQSILHSMADGVVVVDSAGHFLLVNPAAEKLVASGHRDVPPEKWAEKMGFFRPDQSTAWPASDLPLARAMRGEDQDQVEIFVRNPNLPMGRWLSVTARPLRDEAGKMSGALAVFMDISQRKRDEEEIRATNLRLEQRVQERTAELQVANRELEAFSYSVSHDLRAPLRSIDGFSRALIEDQFDKLDEEGKEDLRTVRSAAQRMERLIEGMLMLARVTRTELRRSETDLSALAFGIVEELKAEAPGRTAQWRIEPGLKASVDPTLLRSVLENLLSNAWKFTSKTTEAKIEFGRMPAAEGAAYFVRDNGAGFDPQFAHKLFKAFQRLHSVEEFPGTGVGLASVERIILRHGGRIWAESTGQGATFCFTLSA